MNLVSNAIKFCDLSKEQPILEIKVRQMNNNVHLCIRDNGVGIVKEQQGKVYDMFYRAHKSADGSGIGLYIVKEAINKLNGQIILNSEEAKYTQFDVFLPNQKL